MVTPYEIQSATLLSGEKKIMVEFLVQDWALFNLNIYELTLGSGWG